VSVLLRQPHGFEGFASLRVVLDPLDLAGAQEVDARGLCRHLRSRVQTISVLSPDNDDTIIANREDLCDLVFIARPGGKPVEKGLAHTVESTELRWLPPDDEGTFEFRCDEGLRGLFCGCPNDVVAEQNL
jgi:hypothetical protein